MEIGQRLLYQQVVTEVQAAEEEVVEAMEDPMYTLEVQVLQDKATQEHQEVKHIQAEEEVQEHQVLQVQTQEVQADQVHFFHSMPVRDLDSLLDGLEVAEVEALLSLE